MELFRQYPCVLGIFLYLPEFSRFSTGIIPSKTVCIVSHLAAVRIDLAGGEKICNLQSGQEQQHHSLRHPTQLGRSGEERGKSSSPFFSSFLLGLELKA